MPRARTVPVVLMGGDVDFAANDLVFVANFIPDGHSGEFYLGDSQAQGVSATDFGASAARRTGSVTPTPTMAS